MGQYNEAQERRFAKIEADITEVKNRLSDVESKQRGYPAQGDTLPKVWGLGVHGSRRLQIPWSEAT